MSVPSTAPAVTHKGSFGRVTKEMMDHRPYCCGCLFLSATRWQCGCRAEHCDRFGEPDGPPGEEDHLCPDQGGFSRKEPGQPEQSKTAKLFFNTVYSFFTILSPVSYESEMVHRDMKNSLLDAEMNQENSSV